ncbi:hypothetical protein [Arthrobacter sp. zg-Y877]|uniref:hypothetical protein n=1 Tax=Arthrobacter sp. zg-Y877 TaxID=3049074 RepID=UPI0025A351C8|nr:hypothetical protein [Arthrobacter sp. zg-Y877]MDM7990656.1 hypothetical protein [Arthrobacter sp. zg-Y877]
MPGVLVWSRAMRRALAVSEGDLGILVGSPITVTLYLVLVVALAVSAVQHLRHRRDDRRAADAEPEHETV